MKFVDDIAWTISFRNVPARQVAPELLQSRISLDPNMSVKREHALVYYVSFDPVHYGA